MISESYKTGRKCCGQDCWVIIWDLEGFGPCWGDTEAVSELDQGNWIHGCQGHSSTAFEDYWCGDIEKSKKNYVHELPASN